jgi:DNA polymerase III epsilon subunit-like protein
MKVLVFDTETTGLPDDASMSAFKYPNNWPHIVSISWAIIDSVSNKIVKSHCYLIKPDWWTIPPESTQIHGITHAQAVEFGSPLREVLLKFNNEDYDLMVAHNIHFDHNVLVNAIRWDLGIAFSGFSRPRACSMLASRLMCKIPSPRGSGYKFPKLKELYEFVTGAPPKTNLLHNSLYDTLYLCEIIQTSAEIRNRLGITIPTTNNENQAIQPSPTEVTPAPEITGNEGSSTLVV